MLNVTTHSRPQSHSATRLNLQPTKKRRALGTRMCLTLIRICMARDKFLKITLNWKGISYLRTSVCYCGRMRLLCAKFWGPYSFPLGSSANYASAIQQSYRSRHTNTVYQLKLPIFKRLYAKRKVRPKTCERRGTKLGLLSFILNHFYGRMLHPKSSSTS